MWSFFPPFLPPPDNESERPSSLNGRRIEAENIYKILHSHFGTHDFLEWVDGNGEVFMRRVPPYCDAFGEFLAFWMGMHEAIDIPALMESHFYNYDSLDLSYVEDVIVELEGIGLWKNKMYRARKGSGNDLGPKAFWRHNENVLRARRWLEEAKQHLLQKQWKAVEVFAKPIKQAVKLSTYPWDGLFMGGFNFENLTKMLITLGLITDECRHTTDSKPRNWRAVVEALRDNKRLIRTDAPRLYRALLDEYGEEAGHIPSIRSLQDAFDPKNAFTKQLYEQAAAWLKAS